MGSAVGRAPWVQWGSPPREPGEGKVEGTPEDMHRAGLADERRAKHLEDAFDLDERPPEAVHCFRVIARMGAVVGKRDRALDLDRHGPDLGADTEGIEQRHDVRVEVGDTAGGERH